MALMTCRADHCGAGLSIVSGHVLPSVIAGYRVVVGMQVKDLGSALCEELHDPIFPTEPLVATKAAKFLCCQPCG